MSLELFVDSESVTPVERGQLTDALSEDGWVAYSNVGEFRLSVTRVGSIGFESIIGWRKDAPDAAELEAALLRGDTKLLEGCLHRQVASCAIATDRPSHYSVWTSAGRTPLAFELQKAVWRALGRLNGGTLSDPQGLSEESLAPVNAFEDGEPAPPGERAPALQLADQHGNELALGALRGSKVVLWFHGPAHAPATIEEAKSLARALPILERRDIRVLGIGFEPCAAQRALADSAGLSIPMLSDAFRHAALAYGACTSSAAGYPEKLVVIMSGEGTVLRRFVRSGETSSFVREILASRA